VLVAGQCATRAGRPAVVRWCSGSGQGGSGHCPPSPLVALACWPPWDAGAEASERSGVPLVDDVLRSGEVASVVGLAHRSGEGGHPGALLARHGRPWLCGGVAGFVWLLLWLACVDAGERLYEHGGVVPCLAHVDDGVGSRGDARTVVWRGAPWCEVLWWAARGRWSGDSGIEVLYCSGSGRVGGEACYRGR
jgi:hypothetical protein